MELVKRVGLCIECPFLDLFSKEHWCERFGGLGPVDEPPKPDKNCLLPFNLYIEAGK